jgi:putative ABC transport system substrate-binding protein
VARVARGSLAGGAVALALLAGVPGLHAQPPARVARIGVLYQPANRIDELREGLRALGYTEGQHYVLEIRGAERRPDPLPALAAELARLNVDVIVTSGPQGIGAAKRATSTIPIVMGRMDDADAHGFVASLARPGGNITGLSFQSGELSGKWLELLREAVPRLARVAVLWDATGTAHQVKMIEAAAREMGIQPHVLPVRGAADYERAFDAARRNQDGGMVILASPILTDDRVRLADLALNRRLPAVYYTSRFAEAGGLLSYGPKESEFDGRRAAVFVDKILRGAKPVDLPVEQPRLFEFAVNLKTARALGLAVPPSLLTRADRVIE